MKRIRCFALFLTMLVACMFMPTNVQAEEATDVAQEVLEARTGVLRINVGAKVTGNTDATLIQVGSGFLIGTEDGDQRVITNYHVVDRKALGDFKKAKETAADEEVRQKGASFYAKTCITLTDYQEAIKTLEAKGEYELADWMNLAFAYKCTGNWKKSKELLLQAVLYYPEDYRLYMRLCYLECELQDRKPQALKDYSQLKVYYDKAVSLLNGKTGNEEWIQLKSLIVQLKEYGWM